MAVNNANQRNCFDEFDDILVKRKEPTIQVLYEYEKHYMELVRKYAPEISMIANMLSDYRKEQEYFYEVQLPQIIKTLNQDTCIDDEMKQIWLKRLTTNIDRSFGFTETLINDYATKTINEFKAAVNEKLNNL